jgi:hypothetical protein
MLRKGIRNIAYLAAVAGLATSLGFSQDTSSLKPPPYRGVIVRMSGVFVTPIPGVPLTAVVELESTQILADGSTNVKKTINNIARDLQGRIYNERRQWMNPAVAGTPKLLSFHIYDPLTGLNALVEPATHLARQVPRSGMAGDTEIKTGTAVPARNSAVIEEDLGTQSMENVSVHGARRSITVPAVASGTGKPVVVTDETWYSEELHLNMLVKHDDPRTGQQTVMVTRVNRNEPNPTMFQIPAGYKVVDETPEP